MIGGLLFLALICAGSLFALTGLRQFFLQPLADSGANLVWFILQVLPLVIPLTGMIRGGLRSTFFLCMASTLYFIHGMLIAFDAGFRILGASEIVFALGLCAVTAMMVRRMRESAGAAAGDQ